MKKYLTISAGLLTGATLFLAAAPAMARVDVVVGVPAPVYVAPQPVYVQPRPVYVEHRYRHNRHYARPRHDRDGDGVPNRFDRRPNNPHRY